MSDFCVRFDPPAKQHDDLPATLCEIDAPPRAQVHAQLRNAITYWCNISHQSPLQSFDPGHDHAADRLVLEAVDPGREPRKGSDREHESIVIVRLRGGNVSAHGAVYRAAWGSGGIPLPTKYTYRQIRGKDIWLFGDVRLLPEGQRWPLRLADCKTMPNSGIVVLKYATGPEPAAR
jgi:hypothetical protein